MSSYAIKRSSMYFITKFDDRIHVLVVYGLTYLTSQKHQHIASRLFGVNIDDS